MSASALSHSPAPTAPPVSTVTVGRFSVDFGTLYKLVTIVSGVAIAVFAILEVQYLVAACAITLSAFAIYSCFNREAIPQNPPQVAAISSTQQPPSLGNPLNRTASSTVAAPESSDSEYSPFDEVEESESPSAQRVQQAATFTLGSQRREPAAQPLHPLVRQDTFTSSPFQSAGTRPFSQPLSENEESSSEEEGASGSEDSGVEIFPINYDEVGGVEDGQVSPHVSIEERQQQMVADLLDEQE
ncbi:MAG TPA: hypothetical protein VIJ46_03265 [Rhabdochlamydiaceae bacterium]